MVTDGGRHYLPIPGVANLPVRDAEPEFFFPIRPVLVAQLLSGLDGIESSFFGSHQMINYSRAVDGLPPIRIDRESRGWD